MICNLSYHAAIGFLSVYRYQVYTQTSIYTKYLYFKRTLRYISDTSPSMLLLEKRKMNDSIFVNVEATKNCRCWEFNSDIVIESIVFAQVWNVVLNKNYFINHAEIHKLFLQVFNSCLIHECWMMLKF